MVDWRTELCNISTMFSNAMTPMTPAKLVVFIFLLHASFLPVDARAVTIVNGSLEGSPGASTPVSQNQPPGWEIPNRVIGGDPGGSSFYKDSWSNTPDVWRGSNFASDTPFSSFSWVGGLPQTSPDGGTFVMMLARTVPFSPIPPGNERFGEAIFQTVSGFILGHEYEISVYTSAAPLAGPDTNQYVSEISQLFLDFYSTTDDPTLDPGVTIPIMRLEFPETGGNPFEWQLQSLRFTPVEENMVLVFNNGYKGADSVLLIDGISIIPEPSSALLALLGGSLSMFRRRRQP